MRHTISVLVENKFGVLARVSGLFSGRGYNIDSLCVAETDDPTMSMMTIVTHGEDKIIEQMKPRLSQKNVAQTFRSDVRAKALSYEDDRRTAQYVLLTCLTTSLKLLHPFMPFVTEAVWQQIPRENQSMLIIEQWPQ